MPDMISLEAARRHYDERLALVEVERTGGTPVPPTIRLTTQLLVRIAEWLTTTGMRLKVHTLQSISEGSGLAPNGHGIYSKQTYNDDGLG